MNGEYLLTRGGQMHPAVLAAWLAGSAILSGGTAIVTHGTTDWLGIAAFIAALTGLVTAVLGFAVTVLKMWLDYKSLPSPKQRRKP